MTTVICIRLNSGELRQLDELVQSETGFENRSEVFRLLLAREVRRRKNQPKPQARDWQSAFRTKPRKTNRSFAPFVPAMVQILNAA